MNPVVTDIVLPGVYALADDASASAQRTYVAIFAGQLISAALIPAVLVTPAPSDDGKSLQAVAVAVLFVAGVGLQLLLRLRSYERVWYQTRAVAESVKSMAWKFSMVASPYVDGGANGALARDFSSIPWLHVAISRADSAKPTFVTEAMLRLRSASWRERLDTYVRCRLDDQRDWYHGKSTSWRRFEGRMFWGALSVQLVGVVFAVSRVHWPSLPTAPLSLLSAVVAALVSWVAMRRTSEVAEAYAQAATDLSLAIERGSSVTDDETLNAFVCDSENAISREHTAWLARREVR